MVNKPKKQGTAFETWLVNHFNDAGPAYRAERIAEGGADDRGDIHAWVKLPHPIELTGGEFHILLEAKHRERLNIHQTVNKANKKALANNRDLPWLPDIVAVAWKRTVKKKGNSRRSQDGPVIVSMALEDFMYLLEELRTRP